MLHPYKDTMRDGLRYSGPIENVGVVMLDISYMAWTVVSSTRHVSRHRGRGGVTLTITEVIQDGLAFTQPQLHDLGDPTRITLLGPNEKNIRKWTWVLIPLLLDTAAGAAIGKAAASRRTPN